MGLSLTDTFCGFKAYRVASLAKLAITEPGYGMPLELWVQAAHHGLRIVEIPVPLIYLDEKRSFGGSLDDGRQRLEYYHQVIDRALAAVAGPVELRRDTSDDRRSGRRLLVFTAALLPRQMSQPSAERSFVPRLCFTECDQLETC